MSDSIIAALISAAASITVGLISKTRPTSARMPASAPHMESARNSWLFVMICLGLWLMVSPVAIHHDFAGLNFYVISIVVLILAVARPLPPLSAAWISFAAYSANFVIGPLSNRLAGSQFDRDFILTDRGLRIYIPLLGFAFGTALLSGFVSWLRLRNRLTAEPSQEAELSTASSSAPIHKTDLITSIERLGELHRQGVLSDEEFGEAKRLLLSRTPRD